MTGPEAPRVEQVILEKLKLVVTQELAEDQARTISSDVAVSDWFCKRLLFRLERDVLAHRTHVETQRIPVRGRVVPPESPKDVYVLLPRGFWRRLLRRPAKGMWCPVVGTAEMDMEVAGLADVRAEYFSAFPDSGVRFPDQLGPVRMLVQTQPPTNIVFWET